MDRDHRFDLSEEELGYPRLIFRSASTSFRMV